MLIFFDFRRLFTLKSSQIHNLRGFTLIEIIVVIAIMATLIGILSPMFIKYVERSKQSADVANAESAYAAAMVYFSSCEGHVPPKLYYDGTDIRETDTGISGYGRSTEPFTDFVPSDFPISNVEGTPNDPVPNYIILTMGTSGVEGLGWGVVVAAKHADGTPKYTNRIFTADEWQTAPVVDKVKRDVELFNSLEAAASEMTYGELIKMAADQGLFESNYAGNFCIRIAASYIFKSDHTPGKNIASDVNKIYAKDLFKKAGYDTNLPPDQTYIVTSRQGAETDVWIDFGHTYDEIVTNPELYNAKASDVIVYGDGGGEKFDDGALDHDTRSADKILRKSKDGE